VVTRFIFQFPAPPSREQDQLLSPGTMARMRNRTVFLSLASAGVALLCVIAFMLGLTLGQANLHSEEVVLPNGETVTCIGSNAGGVNCNWNTVYTGP